MSVKELSSYDFARGLLAALTKRGVTQLNEERLADLHAAFFEAYQEVKQHTDKVVLKFVVSVDRSDNTSAEVDRIMRSWLGIYASKDIPGTMWRFRMSGDDVERLLSKLPGDSGMYLRAADAFLYRYGRR
jgi:hypothetical protein